jgi:hypothetical protein
LDTVVEVPSRLLNGFREVWRVDSGVPGNLGFSKHSASVLFSP